MSRRYKDTRREVLLILVTCLLTFLPLKVHADDSSHYDIKATIDGKKKEIRAVQTVTFTNNSPRDVDSVYFHVYANRKYTPAERKFLFTYATYFKVNPFPEGFQEGDVQIQAVTQDREAISFQIEGEDKTLLKVPLDRPLKSGETTHVTLEYTVNIPHAYGRFGWHDNIITLSRWYPILSVPGEEGWANYPFYAFHRPFFSEAARYNVELTVPSDEVLIHSGDVTHEATLDGRWKKVSIDSALPIRDFALAMSPDYKLKEGSFQGARIKIFYLPDRERHADLALRVVQDLMKYYSDRFGGYPYKSFSVAPVYLGYGGEQMSNMMYLDTRVFELPKILDRYFDFLVAHETGHQWFYNLVGIDEYKEMWLEEGVHSYFILQYLESKYGKGADVVQWPAAVKKYTWLFPELTFEKARNVRYKVLARIGLDHPVVGDLSSFQEPSSIFALTYGKGADIVEMLRHLMGEEAFDKVFERIFKEYRFKILSVNDFIRLVKEESAKTSHYHKWLKEAEEDFFAQWLYTDKHFDAAVIDVRAGRVTLRQKGGITMPVDVRVEFADGHKLDFLWQGTGYTGNIYPRDPHKLLSFEIHPAYRKFDGTDDTNPFYPYKSEPRFLPLYAVFESPSPIKKVELDPDQKLLELDRTNNTWPRAVNFKLVPFYIGLYDIPALMPDDAYNVVFGPEIANGGIGVKASFQKPYDQILYAGTDYEFGEEIHNARVGYQLNNIAQSPTAFGFELANRNDLKDDEEDLASGKLYLRRELWPVPYSVTAINDHVSLYLVRNRSLQSTILFGGLEDTRNISYRKHDESIVGVNLHFERARPQIDPREGYKIDALLENSGHFFGATQAFTRSSIDTSYYLPVTLKTRVALRLKYGWGSSDDKNLFELGGWDGLRGYDRKDIRGANTLLGGLEYRFPLRENIRWSFLDNIIVIDALSGVVFFDAGQSWYADLDDSALRKDAGLGLRVTLNIGSFLEKVIIRADVAQAINDNPNDPHVWFGINHSF